MSTNHVLIKIVLFTNVLFINSFIENRTVNSSCDEIKHEQIVDKSPVLGVWKFLMPDADAPYKKGRMFISEKSGKYNVVISLKTGSLNGQDIKVEDNRINFNINIEGIDRTSFVLEVEGDKMIGEFYSENSSSEVLAKRQLPAE
ncbi:hypothetical protein PXD56_04790 [Maribacter sp. SA7]|uniref:hypothetical protein n=1 Tax=Maribacter zhoushanensis TaxID=3030012 RepID=UPI0023EC68B2|nr:hypothetical protein [Maribacter zhoushanensis]MDF4202256.1 hypothetical protein [Maribacter zhoushanensis]